MITPEGRQQLKAFILPKVVGYHLSITNLHYFQKLNQCLISKDGFCFIRSLLITAHLIASRFNVGHGHQREIPDSVAVCIYGYLASNSCSPSQKGEHHVPYCKKEVSAQVYAELVCPLLDYCIVTHQKSNDNSIHITGSDLSQFCSCHESG